MQDFIDRVWDESIVPSLCDFIRIPNKSPAFDPDWEAHGHMERAVQLLEAWCESVTIAGLETEIIRIPGSTPTLVAEVPAYKGGGGNILLYGHYDKQPEFDGWHEGLSPWEPVLREGKLYGRGGADDGYALFGSLTAIAALQRADIPHGRCFLLIEGCEESGSYELPAYIDLLADRVGTPDLVVCLDAECGNYDQLWTTTSLRGMLPGTLTVEVLTEGQHSGAAGGIVPSSFRLLRQVMERIEDADSGQLHACLHVEIPEDAHRQLEAVGQVLGRSVFDKYPWAGDTQPDQDDVVDALVANAWQPSLATVGLAGAPEPQDAGNTLRPFTTAKLVFRLPPSCDAERAGQEVKRILESNPPNNAQVTFNVETPQTGWHAPSFAPWLADALNSASQKYFNKPAMHMGMGGTIPFMKMLGDRFPGVQFMVTGVLGPQSNAHGPNEFLHIGTGKKLTACVADVLAALSTQAEQ